jgi:hypothetical protein
MYDLLAAFQHLSMYKEISFQNSFITIAAAFQHVFGQLEHPKTMKSR